MRAVINAILDFCLLTICASAILGGLLRFADGAVEVYRLDGVSGATLFILIPILLVLIAIAYSSSTRRTKKGTNEAENSENPHRA